MCNALQRIPGIARIVHVGIRDFSEAEHDLSRGSGGRSVAFLDGAMKDRLEAGATWKSIADEIADRLPAMSADENELLDGTSHRGPTSRLSCQVRVTAELDGIQATIAPED